MTDEARPAEPATDTGTPISEPVAETTDTATATAAPEEGPGKLNQAVEIKDIGPCKKHITVSIAREDIDARLSDEFSKLMVDTPVSGFRPGKAPRRIVERRFRKEVTDQVKGQLLMESLEQLATDHDIAALSAPELDPSKIEIPEQGPFIYEFNVEVRPQFDLPNYKGLKLRRPVQTFTDADIAREEHKLLAPYGQIVPKEAPGGSTPTVEVGDYVIVDVQMRSGDQLVNTMTESLLRVDEQLAFKDAVAERFAEQVRGAKAGDNRQVEITLSDAVANPAMKGQKLQANFHIKDIKTIRLPELTHELCHEFGVHSAEQLRELIRVMLERRLEYAQRQAARQQVLQQIAAASEWELPRDLLIRQARRALASRVMEMRTAGISEEEITSRTRLLERDILQTTALALKEQFVLQKIAEVEKLDINDDDINDEIERIAAQNDESPRRVRARLEKDDMMEALATEIIERKALDLVLQSAEYEDVPLGKQAGDASAVTNVEEQAVPGTMQDPTAPPPEAEAQPPTAQ